LALELFPRLVSSPTEIFWRLKFLQQLISYILKHPMTLDIRLLRPWFILHRSQGPIQLTHSAEGERYSINLTICAHLPDQTKDRSSRNMKRMKICKGSTPARLVNVISN
jgi:hypothetical protein